MLGRFTVCEERARARLRSLRPGRAAGARPLAQLIKGLPCDLFPPAPRSRLHQLGHRVTFIPDNLANLAPYAGELQKRGIEVWYHPYIKSIGEYLSMHGTEFDVVILSRCVVD